MTCEYLVKFDVTHIISQGFSAYALPRLQAAFSSILC